MRSFRVERCEKIMPATVISAAVVIAVVIAFVSYGAISERWRVQRLLDAEYVTSLERTLHADARFHDTKVVPLMHDEGGTLCIQGTVAVRDTDALFAFADRLQAQIRVPVSIAVTSLPAAELDAR